MTGKANAALEATPGRWALWNRAASISQQPASWAALAVGLAAAGGPRGRRAAVRGLAGFAAAGVVANVVLKPLIGRRRPDGSAQGIGPVTSSFPSGHAATEVAFALAAAQEMPGLLIPLLAASMAGKVSIIRTRAHYLGDVAAGSLLGVGTARVLWKLWPPTVPGSDGEVPARDPHEFIRQLNRYRFQSTWRVERTPEQVYPVLGNLATYPIWWPEVKMVSDRPGSDPEVKIRAALPYTLRFSMSRADWDYANRSLTVQLRGDLNGWSRWTVIPQGAGCCMLFEEEVEVGKRSLRFMAPFARGLFRANHLLMMRHGQRGLRLYLAQLANGPVRGPDYPGR